MPNEALQQTARARSLFVTCSSLGPPPPLSGVVWATGGAESICVDR
jgi:hypothetical protein